LPKNQYDAVFFLGALGIFDDVDNVLLNIINLCKVNGRIYIFAIINDDPVDVYIRAKRVDITIEEQHLEPGWNVFSKMTLKRIFLQNYRVKSISFHNFILSVDIPKYTDPLRSWTFLYKDGTRGVINSLCLLHTFKLCIVKL
jgi:hypothetical protein